MAQENTVSFKVFLVQEGSQEKSEVRRFGIDRDVVSNFSYLGQKLQTIFPTLRGVQFTVSWKDEDGDDVMISSDDELIIALTEMKCDVHKLYVTVKSQRNKKEDVENGQSTAKIHPGVTCNVCECDIAGFRYKCLECSDYDLCAGCESLGLHPTHFMIRLPTPVMWRPHFGKRLVHHLSKSVHKCENMCHSDNTGTSQDQCPRTRSHTHNHSHGHGHGHHQRGPHVNLMDILANYFGEWTSHAEAQAGCAPSPKHQPASEERDQTSATGTSKPGESSNSNPEPHVQYLLNIGKAVANFLDPLGIDVDVKVDTKKTPPPPTTTATSTVPEESTSQNKESSAQAEKSNEASDVDQDSQERDGWTVILDNNSAQEPTDQEKNNTETSSDDKTSAAMQNQGNINVVIKKAPPTLEKTNSPTNVPSPPVNQRPPTGAIAKPNFTVYYPPHPQPAYGIYPSPHGVADSAANFYPSQYYSTGNAGPFPYADMCLQQKPPATAVGQPSHPKTSYQNTTVKLPSLEECDVTQKQETAAANATSVDVSKDTNDATPVNSPILNSHWSYYPSAEMNISPDFTYLYYPQSLEFVPYNFGTSSEDISQSAEYRSGSTASNMPPPYFSYPHVYQQQPTEVKYPKVSSESENNIDTSHAEDSKISKSENCDTNINKKTNNPTNIPCTKEADLAEGKAEVEAKFDVERAAKTAAEKAAKAAVEKAAKAAAERAAQAAAERATQAAIERATQAAVERAAQAAAERAAKAAAERAARATTQRDAKADAERAAAAERAAKAAAERAVRTAARAAAGVAARAAAAANMHARNTLNNWSFKTSMNP